MALTSRASNVLTTNGSVSVSTYSSSFHELKLSASGAPKNLKSSKIRAIKAVQSQGEAATVERARQRRAQNAYGDFFVDHTCIDCDTCRWMAPQVFTRVDGMSAVFKQPTCEEERVKALQALLSCPTGSIRTEVAPPDIKEVQKSFPIPIDEQRLPGVYHCGYHSEKSYGAASYLSIHPEGNILVDSPRYFETLARRIEMMGGVRYLFLTHIDDVADHKKWAKRFGCSRILHSQEIEASTADVDMKLEGNGPWSLNRDIELIHTPGHTEGSVCLFCKPLEIIFTGDHLLLTENGLSIMERYNKSSVPKQLNSVQKLLDLEFKWILPGHGRRVEFKDYHEKNSVLSAFVQEKFNQYSQLVQ